MKKVLFICVKNSSRSQMAEALVRILAKDRDIEAHSAGVDPGCEVNPNAVKVMSELGYDLSLRILEEALDRLAPGGTLLLYTGSAIVEGVDRFGMLAEEAVNRRGLRAAYAELDPDVFGEELEGGPYAVADRIAAVTLAVSA